MPDDGKRANEPIPRLQIASRGVDIPLLQLNPSKAKGSHKIPSLLLKTGANEMAPRTHNNLSTLLILENYLLIGERQMLHQF